MNQPRAWILTMPSMSSSRSRRLPRRTIGQSSSPSTNLRATLSTSSTGCYYLQRAISYTVAQRHTHRRTLRSSDIHALLAITSPTISVSPPDFFMHVLTSLVDLTMQATGDHKLKANGTVESAAIVEGHPANGNSAPVDPEAGFIRREPRSHTRTERTASRDSSPIPIIGELYHANTYIKTKAKKVLGAFTSSRTGQASSEQVQAPQISEQLATLVLASRASDEAKIVEAEINRIESGHTPDGMDQLPDVSSETTLLRGYNKASVWTQFKLLSGRAFKNLYR